MMPDATVWKMIFSGRIHPEGWLFISASLLLGLIFSMIWGYLGLFFLILSLAIAYFFRDPNRITPSAKGVIVAAADGLVVDISVISPPADLNLPDPLYQKISIFLNIWDVHVNRVPCDGLVIRKSYIKGSFGHAAGQEASFSNERLGLVIQDNDVTLACVQIAGFVARRIVCQVQECDQVSKGERYGLIRFGSRVDMYLPLSCALFVQKGQKMVAGETIIALKPLYSLTYNEEKFLEQQDL